MPSHGRHIADQFGSSSQSSVARARPGVSSVSKRKRRMQFTDEEHEQTLASCRGKAQECRKLAARMESPDNRAEMEKTAAMWDELAQSIEAAQVSSPVDKRRDMLREAVHQRIEPEAIYDAITLERTSGEAVASPPLAYDLKPNSQVQRRRTGSSSPKAREPLPLTQADGLQVFDPGASYFKSDLRTGRSPEDTPG
jgi:hypothetical protein